jgi:methionyl-tRNA formyltransferase
MRSCYASRITHHASRITHHASRITHHASRITLFMTSLNLIFAGTPEFAVPALEALLAAGHRIVAVYTQPDRPAGRGQQVTMSAVKQCALRHGLTVKQPQTLRNADAQAELAALNADAMIVVAYGLILPKPVLNAPRLGCINIHGSILPRWRGAAPIQRAIMAGDAETGVCIMCMDEGLDTGPVLSEVRTPIGAHENAASLHDQLAMLGAQALVDTLPKFARGEIKPQSQPSEGATYASKIKKEEALIDWSRSAREIDALIRAFNPWPIAETRLNGQQLRIWEAMPIAQGSNASPGSVLRADANGIVVATGDGVLNVQRVQLAGRKATAAADFVNAHRLDGAVLGA